MENIWEQIYLNPNKPLLFLKHKVNTIFCIHLKSILIKLFPWIYALNNLYVVSQIIWKHICDFDQGRPVVGFIVLVFFSVFPHFSYEDNVLNLNPNLFQVKQNVGKNAQWTSLSIA